jgi:hypothetical protein
MTHELLASFMYAAGQGVDMAMTRAPGHTPATLSQLIAW